MGSYAHGNPRARKSKGQVFRYRMRLARLLPIGIGQRQKLLGVSTSAQLVATFQMAQIAHAFEHVAIAGGHGELIKKRALARAFVVEILS
jgi:hypothetical protein